MERYYVWEETLLGSDLEGEETKIKSLTIMSESDVIDYWRGAYDTVVGFGYLSNQDIIREFRAIFNAKELDPGLARDLLNQVKPCLH